jgi:hypothetical protein
MLYAILKVLRIFQCQISGWNQFPVWEKVLKNGQRQM